MMSSRRKVLTILGLIPFVGGLGNAWAQNSTASTGNKTATTQKPSIANSPAVPNASSVTNARGALPAANATQDEIKRFCGNIDSQATDARFELQSQQLLQLRAQIDERIKVLEEKRQEYENWLNKRNEFLAKAQDSLVNIISKMRPDAAAAQLALIDDFAAASIILKLSPRISSAIMNELPPEKSASLTKVLVSAQKLPPENKPAPKTANAAQ